MGGMSFKTLLPTGGLWMPTALGCGCAVAAGASSLLHGATTGDPRALLAGALALALLFAWTFVVQRDGVARAAALAPFSLAAAGLAAAFGLALPEGSLAFPVVVLGTGAATLLWALAKGRAVRRIPAPASGYALELLAKPLAYLLAYAAVYGAAFGLMVSFHSTWLAGQAAQAGLAAGLACAGATVGVLGSLGSESHCIDVITRTSLVTVVAGLMFLLQPELAGVAFGVFALGAGLFFYLMARMALDLRETFALPAWMPGGVLGLFAVTLALGALLGWLALQRPAGGTDATVPTVASVLVVIIVTVYGLSSDRIWVARDLKRTHGQDELDHAGGVWKVACSAVADEFGLTQREQEVFVLLAKGRNAAYIEKTLVISNHTVKSHMLNIYKKLGIHSLQELIDLVESRKR